MSAMISSPIAYSSGVLIASPSNLLREQMAHRLNGRCRAVQQVLGGADALAKLEKGGWQVLFLDRRLRDLDAEELISIIHRRFPGIEIVMVDSDGPQSSAENQTEEPVARNVPQLRNDQARVEQTTPVLPGMIGSSGSMQRVYKLVQLVARRNTTVLIAGATGTGKELVARAVHALSPRSSKPLVVVNCAAIPETLLESELFGYTRGAFTGAVQSQVGRIPAANGGTLFLDEVSELPLGMQAKLLRFLEQKEIQRLGATEVTRVDVRVVAASNVDLQARAAQGQFRQDLFYRLSAFPIELPPLRDRREDIVPLAEHFLSCMSVALEMPVPQLSKASVRLLENHSWDGNVRELQHVMERASILVENGSIVQPEHLCFSYSQTVAHS